MDNLAKRCLYKLAGFDDAFYADGTVSSMMTPRESPMSRVQSDAVLRGTARGIREAVPGAVDSIVGLAGGLDGGILNYFSGGSFSDGWDVGFQTGVSKAQKLTNPVRSAMMLAGGNRLRDYLNDSTAKAKEEASRTMSDKEYNHGLNVARGLEEGFQTASEFAGASVPFEASLKALRFAKSPFVRPKLVPAAKSVKGGVTWRDFSGASLAGIGVYQGVANGLVEKNRGDVAYVADAFVDKLIKNPSLLTDDNIDRLQYLIDQELLSEQSMGKLKVLIDSM